MNTGFHGDTKINTDQGFKRFREFEDGQEIKVLGVDNAYHKVTVHCYTDGAKMRKIAFQSGTTLRNVLCTPDHFWFTNEGTTTELKAGDVLLNINGKPVYTVASVDAYTENTDDTIWCVSADRKETETFVLQGNIVTGTER